MTEKKKQHNYAVLRVENGAPLVLGGKGAGVTKVRAFVKEQNRRYHAGEAGGPGGHAASLITEGYWFDEQEASGNYDWSKGEKIALGAALKPDAPDE